MSMQTILYDGLVEYELWNDGDSDENLPRPKLCELLSKVTTLSRFLEAIEGENTCAQVFAWLIRKCRGDVICSISRG